MNNLPKQFNNYDVLAYVVPGYVALFLLAYIFQFLYGLPKDINITLLITLSVIVAYVLGVLFHEFSNILESKLFTRHSEKILLGDSSLLSTEEKSKAILDAKNNFGLVFDQIDSKYSSYIYSIFRSSLKKNSTNPEYIESEIFNVHYGMCRNLFGIFLAFALCVFILGLTHWFSLKLLLVDSILSLIAWIIHRRAERFSKYHVVGVFRAYLQK